MWRAVKVVAALVMIVACSAIKSDGARTTFHFVHFSVPPSLELLPDFPQAITDAAASAKAGDRVIFEIISFMDGPIPLDWYIKAAHRRVEVVKRELIVRGIPAAHVSIGTIMTERDVPPAPEPGHIIIFVRNGYEAGGV